MRHILTAAVMVLGITAAHAQTVTQTNTGSDPLAVPTSSLPAGSSSTQPSSSGTASGAGTTGTGGGTTGISASANTNPQAPLLLPGENPGITSQAAATTATAPSHASPVCPPPVPTTDGGSANLTEMVGGSPGGC
jgi:hypothetical protein